MAVEYSHQPVHVSQDEFHQVDYQVMQQAFMLQNEIGNLWDEHEYQTRLATACASIGLEIFREACISVSHDGFLKNYFMNLLIDGNIYELKTVSEIAAQHHSQTLNYVFLSNVRHAKIINFRQDSVKWKYVSTTLSARDRQNFTMDTSKWNPRCEVAQGIPGILQALLIDWGAYLSIDLYKEALCHFLGISSINESQRFVLLSPNSGLYISGLSEHQNTLQTNLRKYLRHAAIDEISWINFNQNMIQLNSIHHSA